MRGNILSSFTHHNVIPNLYDFFVFVEHQRRYFEKYLSGVFFVHIVEVNGNQNCITSILQNIFFYVPQKM